MVHAGGAVVYPGFLQQFSLERRSTSVFWIAITVNDWSSAHGHDTIEIVQASPLGEASFGTARHCQAQ